MYNSYLYNQPLYNITAQLSLLFHYLYDGSYRTQALSNNRVVIVGQDTASNSVQGEDEDSAELALVGERLDLKLQPLASTASLASQVAAAALDKARLDIKDGFITLPPNCGVELWDVITIQDSLCAQVSHTFRVVGIKLVYDAAQQHYYQHITLGEV